MWCIPPTANAAFVADMENVLDTYQRPYDPEQPVVCMDETTKQLVGETRAPLPGKPGRPTCYDYEYERRGTANVFMFVEALAGWRQVDVTDQRTRLDWAFAVRELLNSRYAATKRVTLVMDNLNTHSTASLYEAFPPAEARQLAKRLEIIHTPKHGSWLNIAEIELSALTRQCLDRRIAAKQPLIREVKAWEKRRNQNQTTVDWQFKTVDARIKLKRLYPKVQS
jgi:DDE superfamily endonuclease